MKQYLMVVMAALLAMVLVMGVSAAKAADYPGQDVTLEPGSDFIPLMTYTTRVRYTGMNDLWVKYPDGYGFGTLRLNGVDVPTTTVEGQSAFHILPFEGSVVSGTVDTWFIDPADGGLWVEVWETILKTQSITGTNNAVMNWELYELPKVEMTFETSGTVTLNGYVFCSGEIRDQNGDIVETTVAPGQDARQLLTVVQEVSAGETWIWTFNPDDSGFSELGLSWSLEVPEEPTPPNLEPEPVDLRSLPGITTTVGSGNHFISFITHTTHIVYTGTNPLLVKYEDGYGFGEMEMNGVPVLTTTVEGETAFHIVPFQGTVVSGTVDTWFTNPIEGALWFEVWETIQKSQAITGTDNVVLNWERYELPKAELTFGITGTATIDGHAFCSGEIRDQDGEIVSTTLVPGQDARQLVTIVQSVSAGETWIWTCDPDPSGLSELGLSWSLEETLTPPVSYTHSVFMPMIANQEAPPEPKIQDITVEPLYALQVLGHKWDPVEFGEETCVRFNFEGGRNAMIESGYFFGGTLSATVDDNPFVISVYEDPNETALQIRGFSLENPKVLTVCTTGTGLPTEIWLRIRYTNLAR